MARTAEADTRPRWRDALRFPALLGVLLLGVPAMAQEPPAAPTPVQTLRQAAAVLHAVQSAVEQLLHKQDIAAQIATPAGQELRGALDELVKADAALRPAMHTLAASLRQAVPDAAPDPLDNCRTANAKLLALGEEILHLYETQDFRSLLLKSYEPLLGLKRVELETLVQDYDDKLRDQEIYPGPKVP